MCDAYANAAQYLIDTRIRQTEDTSTPTHKLALLNAPQQKQTITITTQRRSATASWFKCRPLGSMMQSKPLSFRGHGTIVALHKARRRSAILN